MTQGFVAARTCGNEFWSDFVSLFGARHGPCCIGAMDWAWCYVLNCIICNVCIASLYIHIYIYVHRLCIVYVMFIDMGSKDPHECSMDQTQMIWLNKHLKFIMLTSWATGCHASQIQGIGMNFPSTFFLQWSCTLEFWHINATSTICRCISSQNSVDDGPD